MTCSCASFHRLITYDNFSLCEHTIMSDSFKNDSIKPIWTDHLNAHIISFNGDRFRFTSSIMISIKSCDSISISSFAAWRYYLTRCRYDNSDANQSFAMKEIEINSANSICTHLNEIGMRMH